MSNKLSETVVVTLDDTVATRSYPFTQNTLDQIRDIRYKREKVLNEGGTATFMVPAPVVIAEAIDRLHQEVFP